MQMITKQLFETMYRGWSDFILFDDNRYTKHTSSPKKVNKSIA